MRYVVPPRGLWVPGKLLRLPKSLCVTRDASQVFSELIAKSLEHIDYERDSFTLCMF